MRRIAAAVALVVGVLVGATATLAVGGDGTGAVRPEPEVVELAPVPTVPVPTEGVLLAWVPGGLPTPFVDALQAEPAFSAVTIVLGDTVQLARSTDASGAVVDAPPDGRTIPLDAIAVECATWSRLAPIGDAAAVCELAADEALLGSTSAELRRLGAGGTITLAGGRTLRVAGVVDDTAVGAAELVVPAAAGPAAGVDTPRYALLAFDGDRAGAEQLVRSHSATPVRVRGPGETPYLRHGDAVLPQSLVKATFGEFAATDAGGGLLRVDPAWTARSLVTEDLPLLGASRCHVALLPALRGALEELSSSGLVGSLDRGAAGCWNPRTIAGSVQPSRHAWGAAFDLVPLPADPDVLADVVAVMEKWGFTWGGRWVAPDPVHFEYVRPP